MIFLKNQGLHNHNHNRVIHGWDAIQLAYYVEDFFLKIEPLNNIILYICSHNYRDNNKNNKDGIGEC